MKGFLWARRDRKLVASDFTRRQFLAGSLVFSSLMAGASPITGKDVQGEGYGDVELCPLSFWCDLNPLVADNTADPAFIRRKAQHEVEADFIRSVKVGDMLQIGVVDEDELKETGIGDTGTSSLLRYGFMEEGQVGLLEKVMEEAANGTQMYAVVQDSYALPGLEWSHWLWLSVHAEATPLNRGRLLAIRDSEEAVARRKEHDDDLFAAQLIWALHNNDPLPTS